MRRDEAEEVTFYQDISFGIINCFVHGSLAFINVMLQGEEEDVADEQEPEGEDLAGGDGEDDSDEEVLSCNHVDCGAILCYAPSHLLITYFFTGWSKIQEDGEEGQCKGLHHRRG